MSPNLLSALGLTRNGDGETQGEWKPPTFSGLQNSKPLTTLLPLAVGKENGLEVVKRRISLSGEEAGEESGDGGWGSEEEEDEEGWDYEGMQTMV